MDCLDFYKLKPSLVPLFISNVGSVNYNLNTDTSDFDIKVFCVPEFKDLYNAKYISSAFTKVINGVQHDFDVKDIRLLGDLLYKSNCNYLEMLFSDTNNATEYHRTKSAAGRFLKFLINNRDELTKANLKYLYSSSLGTMNSRVNKLMNATLCNDETSIQMHKCAYHVVRLHRMLKVFESNNFTDFKSAIYYDLGAERDEILNLKSGRDKLTQTELISIVNSTIDKTNQLRDIYCAQPVDIELFDYLNSKIYDLVKAYN